MASLESMRSAVPITTQERRARIARAHQLMADHKIEDLFLAGSTSLLSSRPLG
jgi:hypothetical protein